MNVLIWKSLAGKKNLHWNVILEVETFDGNWKDVNGK